VSFHPAALSCSLSSLIAHPNAHADRPTNRRATVRDDWKISYILYIGTVFLGSMFIVGIALSETLLVCVLQFLAGFFFAPSLAIAVGIIDKISKPAK
jgi:hypothetical protein